MAGDQTYESMVHGKKVKPKVVKLLIAQSSARQGKSAPTKSSVHGNEAKPHVVKPLLAKAGGC